MLNVLSPYALLKASKPRQSDAYVTDYDLYSAASRPAASAFAPPPPPSFSSVPPQPAQTSVLPPTPERTHYIAGIHNRHSRAFSRAKLTGSSLPGQTPTSVSPQAPQL